MRILLNVLYVLTQQSYLSLDGENVVLQQGDTELMRVPLHNLEGIITFGYAGASPALMGACAQRQIAISFLTMHGRFLARVVGEESGNVVLRKTQYRLSDREDDSAEIARSFLFGKIYNARSVIERAMRDYALRLDMDKLGRVSAGLQNALSRLYQAKTLAEMRGIEGEAAALYFSAADDLILQQKDVFFFHGRSRRPPLDPVNALLSFAYTMLSHDIAAALSSVGLDPYVGFLHRDRPGRQSLALDMMEELRAVLADRFVLTLINTRQVGEKGFIKRENGAVILDDDTRRTVLSAWQKHKQTVITHPFLKEKAEWGLVPYIQAMLLARYLRRDLDAYPPFLWK